MKRNEFEQFKKKSPAEIQKNISDYREKLRKLKFDLSQGKVKNISEIKEIKKAIAKLLTIVKQEQ